MKSWYFDDDFIGVSDDIDIDHLHCENKHSISACEAVYDKLNQRDAYNKKFQNTLFKCMIALFAAVVAISVVLVNKPVTSASAEVVDKQDVLNAVLDKFNEQASNLNIDISIKPGDYLIKLEDKNVVDDDLVSVIADDLNLRKYDYDYQVSVIDFTIDNKTEQTLYADTISSSLTVDGNNLYCYNQDDYKFYFNDDGELLDCNLKPGINKFRLKYYGGNLFEYGSVISFNVNLFDESYEFADSFTISLDVSDVKFDN